MKLFFRIYFANKLLSAYTSVWGDIDVFLTIEISVTEGNPLTTIIVCKSLQIRYNHPTILIA